jgi:hypothetical protein
MFWAVSRALTYRSIDTIYQSIGDRKMAETASLRTRYPLRAIAFVAGASALFLGELVLLALFLMPMIPLIPVFILIMIGNACLVSAAVDYASSLARVEPVRTPRAETRAETNEALGAQASRAA